MRISLFGRAMVGLAVATAIPGLGAAQTPDLIERLSAGKIAAISDGDFIVETYATSVLAPAQAGHKDLLTVMSIADGRVVTETLPVSNSVTAAPEILELTPEGRTAFVTERLGERPQGGTTTKDLPAGNRLFAIDLSNGGKPRLVGTAQIGINPESLAVSPDDGRVAVVSNTSDAGLVQIVRFENGKFGPVSSFNLADLGIAGSAATPRGGVTATNIQWHPSGEKLAVNINTQNRVAFFDVAQENGKTVLRPWGEPVKTGADPFFGRFTPDGRHYLTSHWGRNFAATSLADRIPYAASTMSVIRLGDPEAEAPRHERLMNVDTDISAEGMTISPDGRLVATINMRGSIFPEGSPRFDREAGISLLSFDPQTGTLTKAGDDLFEGMPLEGGTFDLSGDHFLATVFQGHPGATPATGPGLEVYKVEKGDKPSLVRLRRVPIPHGVHHVDVSR